MVLYSFVVPLCQLDRSRCPCAQVPIRTNIGRRGEFTVGRMFRRMLRELMRDDIAAAALPQHSTQVDVTTEFVVGALWSTVVWWMTAQPKLSASEVNDVFRRLVFNGIAA